MEGLFLIFLLFGTGILTVLCLICCRFRSRREAASEAQSEELYSVALISEDGDSSYPAPSHSTTASVSDLSKATNYKFKIVPKYQGEVGPESDVSEYIVTEKEITFYKAMSTLWPARLKWYNIGLCLGIDRTDLDAIGIDCRDTDTRFTKMLSLWRNQTHGTWKMLADALRDKTVGFYVLAGSIAAGSKPDASMPTHHDGQSGGPEGFECPLCGTCSLEKYLKRQCPILNASSDTAFPYLDTSKLTADEKLALHVKLIKETNDINGEFNDLFYQMIQLFEEMTNQNLKKVANFMKYRLSISNPLLDSDVNSIKECLKGTSSFFNFNNIRDIIAEFGAEKEKEKLTAYETSFKSFCERSVFEVPEAVFGPQPDSGQRLVFKITNELIKELPHNTADHTTSTDHHAIIKSADALQVSLGDALRVQMKVAEALGIENVGSLIFHGASKGCVELKFSASNEIIDKIKEQCDVKSLTELPGLADLAAANIHILCGPPGKPYPINVTSCSIHLQWSSLEYQGSRPIQYYCVHYKSLHDQSAKWRTVQSKTVIENLEVGKLSIIESPFIFKVQAVNIIGAGVPSENSDPIDLMRLPLVEISTELPSKPGKPEALNVTHNSIELEWIKPEKGVETIISYTIYYRSQFNDPPNLWKENRTLSASERVVVSELAENTTYLFQVQPECEEGIGRESDISDPITTSLMIPSEPGKPRAITVTHDSVHLEWTKPEQGAYNIIFYTIFYHSTSDSSNAWLQQMVKPSQEEFTVKELSPNTVYVFKVRPECGDTFGSESEMSKPIKTTMTACTLFEQLGLRDQYHNKLRLQDALCIGQEYIKLSLNKYPLKDLKQLPKLVLYKLMSCDYMCRSDLSHQKKLSDDESLEDEFFNDSEGSYEFSSVHPVDTLLALFLCSDDFLRQDLFSRLAKCQLSIPFILPDPFTQKLTVPLWAMNLIIKDWKCQSGSESGVLTHHKPIIQHGTPIVTFIRIGKRQRRGASKSKFLNEVISDSHYDHFFYRDCPGGQISSILNEGMVDMCWYLPSGESHDVFPDAITFLNLHGDARNYPDQTSFLSQISSMCFILVTEENLKFEVDDKMVDSLKQFSSTLGGVTVLSDVDKTIELEDMKIHSINVTTKNVDYIKFAIRKRIKRKIQFDNHFKSIEARTEDAITQSNIVTDKSSELYKEGCLLANQIITNCNKVKEEILPLQSGTWLDWAEADKEFYRQFHRGGQTVNNYSAHICDKKKMIRQQQLKYLDALSPVMTSFITSVLNFCGQSNTITRNYFLQCLKIGLDNISRTKIFELQQKYNVIQGHLHLALSQSQHETHEIRKELELLQKEMISSSFGLEHLFCELGQVYEAAQKSCEYQEKFSCLPKAIAELVAEGYPLELMDGDVANVPIQWVSAVLKEVINILEDPKVYVLSVLGLQSSGKSTMLNTSFGLQFNVGAGRCTRGAFMQLLPLDEEIKQQTDCSYVLLVDTEGLRAPERDSLQHDNELATFVIGLADVTLINVYGEPPGDMDDILQISVHSFLRMCQVNLSPSCQFVHQNAGIDIKNEVDQDRFTQKLNKFTADAAREEGCERLYEKFNDVIAFDDHKDAHHFPGLWRGDPPMAPVNSGYSNSAQLLKYNLTELILEKTSKHTAKFIQERVGDLSLSSFEVKVADLWKAVLKENFVFSFKNTLEITAYNSLEIKYSKLDWKFQKRMLDWELWVENEISAANPDQVPRIVNQRCQELHRIISEELYGPLKAELEEFIETSKQSEILVQWKAKFQTKLKNQSEELKEHATNHCKRLGRSKEAITKLESLRERYATSITELVIDLIAKLKEELNENLEKGDLDEVQLKELSKQDLFTSDKLSQYKQQGLLSADAISRINDIKKDFKDEHKQLQHILLDRILSPEEVKMMLKQGRLREEELKVQFNKQWSRIELVDLILSVEDRPVDVAAAVERKLVSFMGKFEGQIIGKLQEKAQYENGLILIVEEKKHYKKLKGSIWIGNTVDWISKRSSNHPTDPYQMEAQTITDHVMDEASKYLEETCKKETNFSEMFILELLHLLENIITEQSAQFKEHFTFLPQYRIDVYLTACCHAIKMFEMMAQSFREKHDPRLYFEKEIKGPLFVLFKHQYYQTKAEEAIANNICAYLYEPIRAQVQDIIALRIVGKMKESNVHFRSKRAMKVKILNDLHEKDDFDSYMLYLTDIKQSFKMWIQHYTVEYCNNILSDNDSRLQAFSKEEASRLIMRVELTATKIQDTYAHGWLHKFCSVIQDELGVKLEVKTLLADNDNIQELNLEHFKQQVRSGLQELKQKLHTSLDDIKCESEMDKWKDKPYDLLRDLIGCTAQCPFCGEQCEVTEPEHSVSGLKHRTSIHRPMCLKGTNVTSLESCSTMIASEYWRAPPDWSIVPDYTAECSLYWKYFIGRYNDAIGKRFGTKPAIVPHAWTTITWQDVKYNLEREYNL